MRLLARAARRAHRHDGLLEQRLGNGHAQKGGRRLAALRRGLVGEAAPAAVARPGEPEGEPEGEPASAAGGPRPPGTDEAEEYEKEKVVRVQALLRAKVTFSEAS